MRKKNGFTLIELVVVILILGILAGVAAPKLFNTSAVAADNGLRQTLSVVRDAIELYAAENAGALPATATIATDLKPYLRGAFPSCPVGPITCQNNSVTDTAATPPVGAKSEATGWKYNANTGEFICNNQDATASDGTVNYDQL